MLDDNDNSSSDLDSAMSQMAVILRQSAETMRYMAQADYLNLRAVALAAARDTDRAAERLELYASAAHRRAAPGYVTPGPDHPKRH